MEVRETEASYYGWRVTAAAHVCVMLGFGLYACTFSVFLKPLTASFGWTRGAISTGFALSALAAAVFSPLMGRWLDRRGPRGALLLSVSLFGATFAGFSLLSAHIWHFYLLCFLAGSVGNLIQMGYTQTVSKWFDARRGFALGIMLAGEGVGLMIFPLASERRIGASGWRSAYAAMAILILGISLPLTFLYARLSSWQKNEREQMEQGSSTLGQSLRSAAFWIILLMLFLSSFGVNGALTHQLPLLTDRGLIPALAAITISILGICSLAGRLLTGWLLDRFKAVPLAFLLLAAAASGIGMLAQTRTFATACMAAALLGFGAGGTSSVTPYLLTRYFGTDGFATLYGLTWTAYAIAGGAGPMLLGYIYDDAHSYTFPLTILAAVVAAGALLILMLPTQTRRRVGPEFEFQEIGSTE